MELLAGRNERGFWEGELSSSALSTATAVTALALAERHGAELCTSRFTPHVITSGLKWLATHQNPDGGWGDTTKSLSNISTTTLCWAAFGAAKADAQFRSAVERAESWLAQHAGSIAPDTLAPAIIARYGKDRTFSVPILTMCALAGRLGTGRDAWRHVIPLPFELAACPHQWFAALKLPVVSYALPALIAIGYARHFHAPSRNPIARALRHAMREKTWRVLESIQPTNGGFLEATPLTSFVTMSLAASGLAQHTVTRRGVDFLLHSQRSDGSWPIDTNLSTWCTTLSVNALGSLFGEHVYGAGTFEQWPPKLFAAPGALRAEEQRVASLARWLLGQQYTAVHPYTHAAPGGWAWTDLPGGVPDADDTCGAMLALDEIQHTLDRGTWSQLYGPEFAQHVSVALRSGTRWLLGLQNRDGGIPTFCRGWGALPFDRSSPDITAHAIRALSIPGLDELYAERKTAIERATDFLIRSQHADGSWIPLWFGNQHMPDDANPVYGTSRVLLGLKHGRALESEFKPAVTRALDWLRQAQNADGSWGGNGQNGTVEETALALEALANVTADHGTEGARMRPAIARGATFLVQAIETGTWRQPSPIGFYFAKLWYYERLYPMIFTVGALAQAAVWLGKPPGQTS